MTLGHDEKPDRCHKLNSPRHQTDNTQLTISAIQLFFWTSKKYKEESCEKILV